MSTLSYLVTAGGRGGKGCAATPYRVRFRHIKHITKSRLWGAAALLLNQQAARTCWRDEITHSFLIGYIYILLDLQTTKQRRKHTLATQRQILRLPHSPRRDFIAKATKNVVSRKEISMPLMYVCSVFRLTSRVTRKKHYACRPPPLHAALGPAYRNTEQQRSIFYRDTPPLSRLDPWVTKMS